MLNQSQLCAELYQGLTNMVGTWCPIRSCASGSANCFPSFISWFSMFHDASVSRCNGCCAEQRNSRCLPHIHLQPKLAKNSCGAWAQLNNLWPSRFGRLHISNESESPFLKEWQKLDGSPKLLGASRQGNTINEAYLTSICSLFFL